MKHVSVIACISAAGESLTPYIVTSQDSPALREPLTKGGVRCETDFMLKLRVKAAINAEIFQKYVTTLFLPKLNDLRGLEQFAEEEIILLIDNAPSHVSEVSLRLLRDAKARVITWPPHTTQIFQQLDRSLFQVMKQRDQYKSPFDDEQGTANFRFQIYHMFKQTMIEANIWGAFQEAGFYFDLSIEPYQIRFDEEKLRRMLTLQESWVLDFPPEKPTPRRWAAKLGWIKRLE
jgi:hypothetical protein